MLGNWNNFLEKSFMVSLNLYLGSVEKSQEVSDADSGAFLGSGEAMSVAKFFSRKPEATGRTVATLLKSCCI